MTSAEQEYIMRTYGDLGPYKPKYSVGDIVELDTVHYLIEEVVLTELQGVWYHALLLETGEHTDWRARSLDSHSRKVA